MPPIPAALEPNPGGAHPARPKPRPRFDLESTAAALVLIEQVEQRAAELNTVHLSVFLDGGAAADAVQRVHKLELTLCGERVRFWSPQLACLVLEKPGGGTLIKARFGPHPHVWGLYLAGYAAGIMLTLGLLVLGCVQLWLNQSAWALWCVPIAMLITALTYGAAYVGQGLGASQMYYLRHHLEAMLKGASSAPGTGPTGNDL